VGSPRIGSDFVFSPASIAAWLLIHFEKDESVKPRLRRRQAALRRRFRHPQLRVNIFRCASRGERGAIAQEMAHVEGIVDEPAFDLSFTFEGKTDERRAAKTEELAAAKLQ